MKIVAKNSNSAAFNENKNMWVWGGAGNGKIGIPSADGEQNIPIFYEFEKQGYKDEQTTLIPYLEEGRQLRKFKADYVNRF